MSADDTRWLWPDGSTSSIEEVWAYESAYARMPRWRRLLGQRPPYPGSGSLGNTKEPRT